MSQIDSGFNEVVAGLCGRNIPIDLGMDKIIVEFKERKSNYMKSLKGISYRQQFIPAKDFECLRKIEVFLEAVRSRYDKEVTGLESIYGKEGCLNQKAFVQEKQRIEDEAFNEAFQTVDGLSIWSHKFSTMVGAGIDDSLVCSPEDSIYFITSYGVSLRFKRANRGKGIRKIILSFMEKTFFLKDMDIVERSEKGCFVREYVSREFLALIDMKSPVKKDYYSPIRIYKRNDRVEIPKLDNSLYGHSGDPVNWIEKK